MFCDLVGSTALSAQLDPEEFREAFTVMQKTEERYAEAEMYRLKGELLLQQSAVRIQHPILNTLVEAEGCFQKAIAIARQQQAKSFELRAVMSVSRLWQQQEKLRDASCVEPHPTRVNPSRKWCTHKVESPWARIDNERFAIAVRRSAPRSTFSPSRQPSWYTVTNSIPFIQRWSREKSNPVEQTQEQRSAYGARIDKTMA